MDRLNQILHNDKYLNYYHQIEECEKDRIFCHHDMVHFLDVARLAQLYNIEEQCGIEKELVYATALLHDIGRHRQYMDGTPHQIASAELAPDILSECGFHEDESEQILEAILNHRNKDIAPEHSLRGIIYRADKMSRSCFACKAEKQCDWKNDKKNLFLKD